MAWSTREIAERHPERNHLTDATHGEDFVKRSIGKALRDLYNPGQLDVMRRIHALMSEPPQAD